MRRLRQSYRLTLSQEWILVPDDLAPAIESRALRVAFQPTRARQLIYFSDLFSNLTHLDISNARLETLDLIPSRLSFLNAGFNRLRALDSAPLPNSLTSLLLHRNQLPKIPDKLAGQSNLRSLNWDHNKLEIFPDWPPQSSLEIIHFGSNLLGSIPSSVANLTNLTILDLNGNRLSWLPDEIGTLTDLEQLVLSKNRLRQLPEAIGNLPRLRMLDVAHNCLPTLPQSVGHLSSLEELFVGHQLTSAKSEASLRASPELRVTAEDSPTEPDGHGGGDRIAVHDESFVLPAEVLGKGLVSLRVLACQSSRGRSLLPASGSARAPHQPANPLTRAQPDVASPLGLPSQPAPRKLRHLPGWVCQLGSLEELDLEGNELTAFPERDDSFGLPALEILCLDWNRLQALPRWLGKSSDCRVIKARGNRLTEIPEEILELIALDILDVRDNVSLVVPYPTAFGRRRAQAAAAKAEGRGLKAPPVTKGPTAAQALSAAGCSLFGSALSLLVVVLAVALFFAGVLPGANGAELARAATHGADSWSLLRTEVMPPVDQPGLFGALLIAVLVCGLVAFLVLSRGRSSSPSVPSPGQINGTGSRPTEQSPDHSPPADPCPVGPQTGNSGEPPVPTPLEEPRAAGSPGREAVPVDHSTAPQSITGATPQDHPHPTPPEATTSPQPTAPLEPTLGPEPRTNPGEAIPSAERSLGGSLPADSGPSNLPVEEIHTSLAPQEPLPHEPPESAQPAPAGPQFRPIQEQFRTGEPPLPACCEKKERCGERPCCKRVQEHWKNEDLYADLEVRKNGATSFKVTLRWARKLRFAKSKVCNCSSSPPLIGSNGSSNYQIDRLNCAKGKPTILTADCQLLSKSPPA